VIAVCDAWDAMRTDRVYRAARPFDEALEALRAAGGAQLDARIVGALVIALERDGLA
jgi:HD-GYP domain-containing protein (c-di-GMP phosphodiesterase class II)